MNKLATMLKPCPHCGGLLVDELELPDLPGDWAIKCKECGAHGPGAENVEDARARWNAHDGKP